MRCERGVGVEEEGEMGFWGHTLARGSITIADTAIIYDAERIAATSACREVTVANAAIVVHAFTHGVGHRAIDAQALARRGIAHTTADAFGAVLRADTCAGQTVVARGTVALVVTGGEIGSWHVKRARSGGSSAKLGEVALARGRAADGSVVHELDVAILRLTITHCDGLARGLDRALESGGAHVVVGAVYVVTTASLSHIAGTVRGAADGAGDRLLINGTVSPDAIANLLHVAKTLSCSTHVAAWEHNIRRARLIFSCTLLRLVASSSGTANVRGIVKGVRRAGRAIVALELWREKKRRKLERTWHQCTQRLSRKHQMTPGKPQNWMQTNLQGT